MIFQQINQLIKRIYLLTKRNRRENSVNALMLFAICNYRKLPLTTANYRRLPLNAILHLFSFIIIRTTANNRQLPSTTANYRKLPPIAIVQLF
jgi:hypothetical protein